MSETQLQQALQRLYEDSSVRGDLTDDESEALLQWGEEQIKRLAAQEMDSAAFEEAYSNLARLLTRMGRLAAGQANMAPEEAQAALEKVNESAQALGLQPAQSTFSAQAAPEDVMATLQALIAQVDAPAEAASAQSLEAPAEAAPAHTLDGFMSAKVTAEKSPEVEPSPKADSAEKLDVLPAKADSAEMSASDTPPAKAAPPEAEAPDAPADTADTPASASGLGQLISGIARFLSAAPDTTEGEAAHGEEKPEQR